MLYCGVIDSAHVCYPPGRRCSAEGPSRPKVGRKLPLTNEGTGHAPLESDSADDRVVSRAVSASMLSGNEGNAGGEQRVIQSGSRSSNTRTSNRNRTRQQSPNQNL